MRLPTQYSLRDSLSSGGGPSHETHQRRTCDLAKQWLAHPTIRTAEAVTLHLHAAKYLEAIGINSQLTSAVLLTKVCLHVLLVRHDQS
jgi:hypothetical protein